MYRDRIVANNFKLKSHNKQIYRVIEKGSATILWLSREDAIAYLLAIQLNSLGNKTAGFSIY